MSDATRTLVQRWREDPNATYRSWFLWEERVKNGIFLAPLILLMGWVETRRTAAVSAAYNLLNSAAALAGAWTAFTALPSALPWWLGGAVWAWLGNRHLPTATLRYLLSAILALSGMKMQVPAVRSLSLGKPQPRQGRGDMAVGLG